MNGHFRAVGRLALLWTALAGASLVGLVLSYESTARAVPHGSGGMWERPARPRERQIILADGSSFAGGSSLPTLAKPDGPAPLRAGDGVPRLEMSAEPDVARFLKSLAPPDPSRLREAMRLAGLDDPGPPIRVFLVGERSAPARAAPSWAAAYARSDTGTIVVMPTRTPTYPDGSLEGVLIHEVSHVLVGRAARGQAVPHWFNEGVAMTAARERDVGDRARLIFELLPGGSVRLSDLDSLFGEGYGRAARAYTLSGAFVGDLVARAGADAPGRILALIAEGRSFDEAFARVTGTTLTEAEASFWRRQNLWNRWVPILTSTFTLWTGITLLAIWAIGKRRRRDARIRELWKAEETPIDQDEPPDRYSIN